MKFDQNLWPKEVSLVRRLNPRVRCAFGNVQSAVSFIVLKPTNSKQVPLGGLGYSWGRILLYSGPRPSSLWTPSHPAFHRWSPHLKMPFFKAVFKGDGVLFVIGVQLCRDLLPRPHFEQFSWRELAVMMVTGNKRSTKGSHPTIKVQFVLTLFKKPLTPPHSGRI